MRARPRPELSPLLALAAALGAAVAVGAGPAAAARVDEGQVLRVPQAPYWSDILAVGVVGFRGALLGEGGVLCGALLAADSKQAKKRDDARRAAARAKAQERFDEKTAEAIAKAEAAGVAYPGSTAAEIGDGVAALAGHATSHTAGVE